MKKDIVIFAVLATVCTLSSCSQEPDVIGNDPGQGVTVFTATIESGATKTALSGNGDNYDVLWRSGDAIAVADEAGTPNVGLYTTESVTDHADFSLRSGAAVTTPSFKAWYPADLHNDGTPVLPEVQTYVEGGSATEGNICRAPMYAVSGTSTLLFKNICGIVKLNLTSSLDGLKVRRIILNADEGMSGAVSNCATLASDYVATVSGDAGVTLDCGTAGIPVNASPRAFHIAVPANTYHSFKITVVTTSGRVQTKTAGVDIVVGRSKITTISSAFDGPLEDDGQGTPAGVCDLSERETANTYIVPAAGSYKFKATVKGNGGFDPLTGTTATEIDPADISGVTVLWELYKEKGRAIKVSGDYVIDYSDGYVSFSTPETFRQGGACVAIFKDGEGGSDGEYDKESDEILWSWLLWMRDDVGTMTHNGKTFMNCNLGATTIGTNYVRGYLYQWGRKDAFSAAAGDVSSVYWFTPIAAEVFSGVSTVESVAYTIAHPTTRIACWTSAVHSWMPEAEYSTSPWRVEVKTIYDPCPPGWKVPKKEDMDGITGLPATGLYSSDNPGLRNFGNADRGYYWTSTISDNPDLPANAWAFKTGSNLNNWSQAEGYAIRPVRE